MKESSQIA
jgi:Lon-like ATP-dependent protease